MMQLVGQTVEHESFGKGNIVNVTDKIITVEFPECSKKFLYPEAFSQFLKLNDREAQDEINEKYREILKEERDKKRDIFAKLEHRKKLRTMKVMANSQGAFNVDWENSREVIKDGRVSTGEYLSGKSKGMPRIPGRLKPNSACIITSIPKGCPEEERQIVGAFMVNEEFEGEECTDGFIDFSNEYRIILPEGKSLSYWKYMKAESGGKITRWGRAEFKYFTNTVMSDILHDIAKVMVGTEDEEYMNKFYRYFCLINKLPEHIIR